MSIFSNIIGASALLPRTLLGILYILSIIASTTNAALEENEEESHRFISPPIQCTCFSEGVLRQARKDVIANKVILAEGTCEETEGSRIDLKYSYPDTDYVGGFLVEIDSNAKVGTCVVYPDMVPIGPNDPLSADLIDCYHDLAAECNAIKEAQCPCFSYDDIKKLQERLVNDDAFTIDIEKSCQAVDDDKDGTPFGIYQTDAHPRALKWRVGVMKRMNPTDGSSVGMCFDGYDVVWNIKTWEQFAHCENLVNYLCDSLSIAPMEELSCKDKGGHGVNEECDASRTGSSDNKAYCQSLTVIGNADTTKDADDDANADADVLPPRVFEMCRASCGKCECKDDSKYFFNGQPDKGCAWVAENPSVRCADMGASKHCVDTCNSSCCKDDSEYTVRGMEGRTCDWIARKGKRLERLCARARPVWSCPETCDKCRF